MNTRLELVASSVKTLLTACNPVPMRYKVTWFERIFIPEIKMYRHQKRETTVMAYSSLDAAKQVNPKFRPGYNCWVSRIFK